MTAQPSPTAPRNTTATPAFSGRVVELDVREDLRNGREPFSRIMEAVQSLAPEDALHLRATFEPVPLFRVLANRGLDHIARQNGPEDWSIWFHRESASVQLPPEPVASPSPAASRGNDSTERPAGSLGSPSTAAGEEVVLDVRGLEPPEPMVRTLTALESLAPGMVLVQHNERVPRFLLPILAERGFEYEIDESEADRVVVRIRRSAAPDSSPGVPEPGHATSPQPHHSRDMQTIELDVRVITPREKHPTIFKTFDGLSSGQSMVIVNDHDPRPLRYQLAAERPEMFEWTYQEEGPEVWKVRIDRK